MIYKLKEKRIDAWVDFLQEMGHRPELTPLDSLGTTPTGSSTWPSIYRDPLRGKTGYNRWGPRDGCDVLDPCFYLGGKEVKAL
ncbi:hypothetical protein LCGC14_2314700 [marine sediment metagenome]|uniref:Uncharacterized protein n=1 Tax=marine sediment metagenome TaxID=412755 RepID=A0A0F9CJM7_9ZZZZ